MKRIHRIKLLSLFVLAMCMVTGCGSKKPENEIHKTELTESESKFLDLVNNQNKIDIFNYSVDESYKVVTVWNELYQEGEFYSKPSEIYSPIDVTEGRIAIVVDEKTHSNWRLTIENDGFTSISTSEGFNLQDGLQSASSSLNTPIEIEESKEIIIGVYVLKAGNELSIFSPEYFEEHPEQVNEYDFVYLVKCRFDKTSQGATK